MVVVFMILAAFFKFWLHLPVRTKVLFAAAVAIFIGGAVGVEMYSAWYRSEMGGVNFEYRGLLAALEEGMEKLGILVLIYALLDYLRQQKISFNVKFR